MRPTSSPHNCIKRILILLSAAIFLSILMYGLYIDNIYLILIGLVSVPLFFFIGSRFIWYITTKIEITENGIKTTNNDFLSPVNVLMQKKQNIAYKDIKYVYFAEKEIYTVKAIKEKLGKYKIDRFETNVTRKNLVNKYNVPEDLILRITGSKGVRFNENNIVSLLLLLEELEVKYNLPEELIKNIKIDLSKTQSYTNKYFEDKLAEYNIKREDMAKIREQIKVMEVSLIDALCVTSFSLVRYLELSNRTRVDWTLVLSNERGDKKAYVTHFLDYSLEQRKAILNKIKENTNARFLLDLDTLKEHEIKC